MVKGELVAEWTEPGIACLSVRVDEGKLVGVVEYVARLPLDTLLDLSEDEKRDALLDDIARQRRLYSSLASPKPLKGRVELPE